MTRTAFVSIVSTAGVGQMQSGKTGQFSSGKSKRVSIAHPRRSSAHQSKFHTIRRISPESCILRRISSRSTLLFPFLDLSRMLDYASLFWSASVGVRPAAVRRPWRGSGPEPGPYRQHPLSLLFALAPYGSRRRIPGCLPHQLSHHTTNDRGSRVSRDRSQGL